MSENKASIRMLVCAFKLVVCLTLNPLLFLYGLDRLFQHYIGLSIIAFLSMFLLTWAASEFLAELVSFCIIWISAEMDSKEKK